MPLETSILRMMIKDPDKKLRQHAIARVGKNLHEHPQNLFFMKLSAAKDAEPKNRESAQGYVETLESKEKTSPDPNNPAAP